jgi:hypothetical protein
MPVAVPTDKQGQEERHMDLENDITSLRGYCWLVYDRVGEPVEMVYTETDTFPDLPDGYRVELVNGGDCLLNADIGGMVNVKVKKTPGKPTMIVTHGFDERRLVDAIKSVLEQRQEPSTKIA